MIQFTLNDKVKLRIQSILKNKVTLNDTIYIK